MVRRHVLSVIFLALVSANVIQAGVIPLLFHHEALPNFINLLDIPRIGGFASSMASTALHGFKSYFDDFHTGLGGLDFPFKFDRLHRFINGGILPGLAHPAILNGAADTVADAVATRLVPSTDQLIGPGLLGRGLLGRGLLGRGLLGNYGVGGLGGGAASAGAAGSAAAGA